MHNIIVDNNCLINNFNTLLIHKVTQLKIFFIYISFIGYLFSQQDRNQSLSINIPFGVGIEVSGKVGVEFINVEGKVAHNIEMSLFRKLIIEVLLLK